MARKQGKKNRTGTGAGSQGKGQDRKMATGVAPSSGTTGRNVAGDPNAKPAPAAASASAAIGAARAAQPKPGTAAKPHGSASTAPGAMPGATAATEAPKSPPLDKVQALGHALWLMTQSPAHRHMFVADMEWLLIAPVSLGQFRLWRHGNQPIGFVTWAFVSDEVDERLRRGEVKLKPQDWKSGEKAWLIDMIMPFGGRDEALKELKERVFATQELATVLLDADGRRTFVRL